MGYRDNWLRHAGSVSRHSEVVLHAYDREIPIRPMRMLLIGVENGGSLEVWRDTLPAGSEVIGLDINPACGSLPDLNVVTCDVSDKQALRRALAGQYFDTIIDSTSTMSPYPWPFLRPQGVYVYEGYQTDMMMILIRDLALDGESWLPVEEILRVDMYPDVAVIEKRQPRVTPYLQIMTGNFCDVTDEREFVAAGVKRVVL